MDDERVRTMRDYRIGFTDKEGKLVIPCVWNYAGSFQEGLASVINGNGLCGFINKTGEIVVPCIWREADDFSEGLASVKNENGLWGFINKSGELVIPCEWDVAYSFQEGLASVRNENGFWGFINKTGEIVVPCIWREAEGFSEGLACVFDGNKYGYIDKNGKQVIPCKWECACSFEDGLASVDEGFINKAGEWVFHNKEWEQVSSRFYSGIAFWEDSMGNIGTIDKTGRITVLPLREPNDEERQDDELFKCSRIDDSTGKIILTKYHNILYHENFFDDGLCMVKDKSGKIGYYDMFGKIVIPCKWTSAYAFSDGAAAVMNEEHLWGFIDVEGNIIIECQWISVIEPFILGVAVVSDDDDEFAIEHEINKRGESIIYNSKQTQSRTQTRKPRKRNCCKKVVTSVWSMRTCLKKCAQWFITRMKVRTNGI